MSVLLKKPLFQDVTQQELAEQLEAKKKCRQKLPIWFSTSNIYYPNKLNIEQTSSEKTARYKAGLVSGKSILDMTGGLGVDSYFFAQKTTQVFHCEWNANLSEIASHNFKILGANNINSIIGDGIEFLKKSSENFDWIYVDPSRRDNHQSRVFLLKDCEPNVPENLDVIFEKTNNLLIKTSPLLDISQGISELKFVKEIHVVAIKNEVKELLFLLENGFDGAITIKTINLKNHGAETFEFIHFEETNAIATLSTPEKFLYEPNAAILKSGAFKLLGNKLGLKKLHEHSHLYTSNEKVEFPGRVFQVEKTFPYSKKEMKSLEDKKINITTRNFPVSVAQLRKAHKLKDGGEDYLFFTKDVDENLVVMQCNKC